ncbi:hypothetical protein ILT44_04185 [Microvirga sp. BT689]|uniref:hypothetical protein n=1 Tax=Microvirga arvi TaxID=2778731 RepID=UPI001950F455|nr:hypothetical protein [Microvirga arvi]MBM6579374.1 hypothetical protein [Microvirga arvi]
MIIPTSSHPAISEGFCSNIRHPAGLPFDVRIVTSPVTPLVLGTCLVDNVRSLVGLSEMHGPAAYLHVDPDTARAGETVFAPRRLLAHDGAPPFEGVEQVIIIRSQDPYFGKDEVMLLQSALAAGIAAAGRCTVIQGTGHPSVPVQPGQRALLRRWMADLRLLLIGCGFHGLEPVSAAELCRSGPTTGFSVAVPHELLDGSNVQRYRIERDGIRAECSRVGPWTILHRGSTLRPNPIESYQVGLAEKRKALTAEGILVSGRTERDPFTLTADIAVPSLTNASRLVLGNNSGPDAWQEVDAGPGR